MTYNGPKDFPVTELGDIHDGDTYWMTVDQGLRNYRELDIRLDGWDTPEMTNVAGRQRSPWEKTRARDAQTSAASWLRTACDLHRLRVTTEPDPVTYGRWTGRVYARLSTGEETDLGQVLAAAHLAVPWHKTGDPKWYQVYDRPGWLPGTLTG